jgi:type IV pilus assembly protein PilB
VTGQRFRRTRQDPVRKRLGEILVEARVLDGGQLETVLSHQRRWGGKLGQVVVGLRLATEQQVVSALAVRLDCPTVDLVALEPGPELEAALKVVPGDLALRHKVLPIRLDQSSLTVAMADPSNVVVTDELAFLAGRRVRTAIAGEHEIVLAVRRLYFLEPVQAPVDARMPQRELQYEAEAPPAEDLELEVSPRQAAVLDALSRAGRGEAAAAFEPSRLAAAVARLLVLKGVISDLDLLAELAPRR